MKNYYEVTPYIKTLADISCENNHILPDMYTEHNVKRGLRDVDGNGVITGLTEISKIVSKTKQADGTTVPCEGELYYRGINIRDFASDFLKDNRFGFEEAAYLLLFSQLPDANELEAFKSALSSYRHLPVSFARDMIMKAPSNDVMNSMSRSVLALYSYDKNANDTSVENVLRQCLQMISLFPLLAVYGYQAFMHYYNDKSLYLRHPHKDFTTAQNLLHLLRNDGDFTYLESKILDLALVLHAEHGGGNNSSFTTHVVTSSGTDTYSAFSAALGSLKGPRHGGANVKVVKMFDDMKENINTHDKGAIKDYLVKLLDKNAFDKSGLIYGIGHAVYSVSDPRAEILKKCAKELSSAKNFNEEFELYETVAQLAQEVIGEKRQIYKGVSANVDFYSGLVYQMLELPCELFTPIFAVSRIAGWSAHRIEEIQNAGKIIRPAYISVKPECKYIPMHER